jgi:hypothetical protein
VKSKSSISRHSPATDSTPIRIDISWLETKPQTVECRRVVAGNGNHADATAVRQLVARAMKTD